MYRFLSSPTSRPSRGPFLSLALLLLGAAPASAQDWQPFATGGLSALSHDGRQVATYSYGPGFSAGHGNLLDDSGALNGTCDYFVAGLSDGGAPLLRDYDTFQFFLNGHGVETPSGEVVYDAKADRVGGTATFQNSVGEFFRMGQDGVSVALANPSERIYAFTTPAADGSFLGSGLDGGFWRFDGASWSEIEVTSQFGRFYPSGGSISSTRYATGRISNGHQARATWNGTGYDIVDLGPLYDSSRWVSSLGTNDDGTSLLLSADRTVLFDRTGSILYSVDQPAGKWFVSGDVLMGNGYSYANFNERGSIEDPFTYRIATPVPEPASLAALGLGALALARRRPSRRAP